ncbi:MAG: chromate resistance protein ChrB [Alphaproteobacteria bacterium]|nr:chromate resistance protein ChrB [Alphaproteobacteria bacterium]
MKKNQTWLLLTYKVQPEPATKRIALWRKIKAMGAIYLQSGVCLLPKTEDHLRRLRIIENEIAAMQGEAVLLETIGLDPAQEEKVIARFNADRNEAYHEFLERCDGFFDEISRESAAGKFTYAELEENDEDLKKLRSWLDKILKLDFYKASLSEKATERLSKCVALLETFSRQVFEAQEENRSQRSRKKAITKKGTRRK